MAMETDRSSFDSMMERSCSELEDLETMLDNAEPGALRDFLLREMERLPDLKARFEACF